MDELTGEFVAETRETLERIGEALVGWEAHPDDPGRLDQIFRFVHTVKGSCGFLDLPRIGALAHAAETALSEARDGKRTADVNLVGAMLGIVDRIAVLADKLDTGGEVPDPASDDALIARIDNPEPGPTLHEEVGSPSAARNVRISVDLLDSAMTQVSDLVLARNELARNLRQVEHHPALAAAFNRLSSAIAETRETIARTRMQPIERLFASLPRLVRDTANTVGKAVRLVVEGSDVEIDREMIEAIRDPLTHIVRNAIDHGLEHQVERARRGKPPIGTISVRAVQAGNQVSITIADDGQGINVARLTEKAVAAGVVTRAKADMLLPEAAVQLIFEPGLSTVDEVTEISGRGVGMDVVRANVERLGGSILLDSRPGVGLSIMLRAPLTLSIMNALIVEAGSQKFAVPRLAVDEIVSLSSTAVRLERIGEGEVAVVRGRMLSVVPLGRILGAASADGECNTHLAIIELAGGTRYGLAVSRMGDPEEVVVRPTPPALASLGVFAGQTLPDSGVPMLVLDPVGLAIRAGIDTSVRHDLPQADTVALAEPGASMLLFQGLDGVRRAIRARDVDHIADATSEDFISSGSLTYLTRPEGLLPVILDGKLPTAGVVAVLRLGTADGPVFYPVAAVEDLAPVPSIAPVDDGIVEGFVVADGRPVALLAWPRRLSVVRKGKRA